MRPPGGLVAGFRTVGRQFLPGDATRPTPADHFRLLDLTRGRVAGPYERSIDVLVSRLRQKIERDPREPEFIKTIRSGGYLFTPQVERS